MIIYVDLDRHFTAPKVISPFYSDDVRIPRKIKKDVKAFCGLHWSLLTNSQRLWYYLEKKNNNYKRFIMKKVIQ